MLVCLRWGQEGRQGPFSVIRGSTRNDVDIDEWPTHHYLDPAFYLSSKARSIRWTEGEWVQVELLAH